MTPTCGPRPWSGSPRPLRGAAGTRAAVTTSPLPGPSGNVEFFLWLRRDAPDLAAAEIAAAVRAGGGAGVRG